MQDKLIDILERVDGELFCSWIMRNIKWYQVFDSLKGYKNSSIAFCGAIILKPDLVWPDIPDVFFDKDFLQVESFSCKEKLVEALRQ